MAVLMEGRVYGQLRGEMVHSSTRTASVGSSFYSMIHVGYGVLRKHTRWRHLDAKVALDLLSPDFCKKKWLEAIALELQ